MHSTVIVLLNNIMTLLTIFRHDKTLKPYNETSTKIKFSKMTRNLVYFACVYFNGSSFVSNDLHISRSCSVNRSS